MSDKATAKKKGMTWIEDEVNISNAEAQLFIDQAAQARTRALPAGR